MKVLDKSWVDCLRMWEWVSENIPEGFSTLSPWRKELVIDALKVTWLKENRFTKRRSNDCFFCEYDEKHGDGCNSCPARLVGRSFHCDDEDYSFRYNPVEFYQRIQALDKVRKEK